MGMKGVHLIVGNVTMRNRGGGWSVNSVSRSMSSVDAIPGRIRMSGQNADAWLKMRLLYVPRGRLGRWQRLDYRVFGELNQVQGRGIYDGALREVSTRAFSKGGCKAA
jgi:hypothetical protein